MWIVYKHGRAQRQCRGPRDADRWDGEFRKQTRYFPTMTRGLNLKEMANWLELGGDFFDGLNQEALWSRLVKKLVSLGYQVTLTPASSEAAARAL